MTFRGVKQQVSTQCKFPIDWMDVPGVPGSSVGVMIEGPFRDLIRIVIKQVLNGDYEVSYEAQVPVIHPFRTIAFYEGEEARINEYVKTRKRSARKRKRNKR